MIAGHIREGVRQPDTGPDRAWSEWDQFVESRPDSGFMQTSWWAEFRAFSGYEYFGSVVRKDGAIVGGATVLRFAHASDACFYYIQDGPILPEDRELASETMDVILDNIEQHRRREGKTVTHLRLEPRWLSMPAFLSGYRPLPALADPFTEPRDTLCVAVDADDESLLAGMKPKGRYNIRLAKRHGIDVCEDNSARGIADFIELYAETAERQALNAKPDDYFETLVPALDALGKGGIHFAELGGQRLAAAIVVYFGRRATYLFGGSTERLRHLMAPYALHFGIMREARARGCRWYDLWGIAPSGASAHPWEGITAFKRKFGGVEVNLTATLDRVYDQAAYRQYAADNCGSDFLSLP
ncbi:MAG: peptidoglycan bridge formation glycyltransferase FemA/FemB family protein [Gammaproteobacteria bacterium]|jgi:lipid II:glycine glycyltransferase (peptidoglycan interpeptide bridge formation enzyme)